MAFYGNEMTEINKRSVTTGHGNDFKICLHNMTLRFITGAAYFASRRAVCKTFIISLRQKQESDHEGKQLHVVPDADGGEVSTSHSGNITGNFTTYTLEKTLDFVMRVTENQ